MAGTGSDDPWEIVRRIRAKPKYRAVSPDLIARLATQELPKRARPGEAEKVVRRRLHQLAGAYLAGRPDFDAWLARLEGAGADEARRRRVCHELMGSHASTRERLPALDRFFTSVMGTVAPVGTVVDLACGLTPLAIPWMPLHPGATYHAFDIFEDMIAFLGRALMLFGMRGAATARDVTGLTALPEADVALLLKAVPCLDQIDPTACDRLLDLVRARVLVISFPVGSLGGGKRWNLEQYRRRFDELMRGRSWCVQEMTMPGELTYVLTRPP